MQRLFPDAARPSHSETVVRPVRVGRVALVLGLCNTDVNLNYCFLRQVLFNSYYLVTETYYMEQPLA